jgi:spore coat polysaccharide biosynthesis protein SpsF
MHLAVPHVPAIVLTSVQPSDDPLAAYLHRAGIPCFRGRLDDVLHRFQACLHAHPCQWVVRVCADSPLLDAAVVRSAVEAAVAAADEAVITTTSPRTFAKGQNVEIVRAAVLASLAGDDLTPGDREHVTAYLYRHPTRFKVLNLESGDPRLADTSFVVDTIDDYHRIQRLDASELRRMGCAYVLDGATGTPA